MFLVPKRYSPEHLDLENDLILSLYFFLIQKNTTGAGGLILSLEKNQNLINVEGSLFKSIDW